MIKRSILLTAVPLLFWGSAAGAGDVAAGKTAFEAQCAECHYEDDFAGESVDDIMGMIQALQSGEVEHKGAEETAATSGADLANIAAYWASIE